MGAITFLAFAAIIIVLVSTQSSMSGKIGEMKRSIDQLSKQIIQLNTIISKQEKPTVINKEPAPIKPEPIIEKPPIAKPTEAAPIIKPAETPSVPEVKEPEKLEKAAMQAVPAPKAYQEPIKPTITPIAAKAAEPKIIAPPKQTFFERNPDLEKFIGENLINKIGIAILVIGIAFFVRFAISKEWIGPIGRAAIGILCGGILIAFAHRLRKSFAAFSSVLVGGGLAVLYFTITISFHEYHLFSQTVAFVIMVVITAFSVLLSVSYDRVELAVLAIIGGFASPFLLSTGEGNYLVLFTYVAILNSGILTLAFFKRWNMLNIISYAFTILLYTGWFITKVVIAKDAPYFGALGFVTLFYLQFFLTFIINNILQQRKFNLLEISLLLSNTFLYFAAGIYLLYHVDGGKYNGLFTLLLATINFIFAVALYKKDKVDKNLVYLLIGLVLTFVSLAAPIQLKGNQITMFWAAEAALLCWLAQQSKISLMKYASLIVMLLMFGSLIIDWDTVYFKTKYIGEDLLPVIWNKGFITGLVALGGLFLTTLFLKKQEDEIMFEDFAAKDYRRLLQILLLITFYIVLFLELHHQLHAHLHLPATINLMLGSFNLLYLLFLLFISTKINIKQFGETIIGLVLAAILTYPMFYHHLAVSARNFYLVKHGEINGFMYHYVLVALIIVLLFFSYRILRAKPYFKQGVETVLMVYCSLMMIFLASAELDHTVVLMGDVSHISYVLSQNHKIGFPILWGICSFALMFLGMRYKKRELRIISLSLFLIIILKLFIFDLKGMSEGGKIAAFIFLGIILLVVSFMYQKLKKLVLDNDAKTETK